MFKVLIWYGMVLIGVQKKKKGLGLFQENKRRGFSDSEVVKEKKDSYN